MKLREILSEKKPEMLQRWFDGIAEDYPPDTARFLKNQKNQFANPVGTTLFKSLDEILEVLLSGTGVDAASSPLDEIIRVRAVQDFTASQAVSFLFLLKKIIRDMLAETAKQGYTQDELAALDAEIDSLALISFDIYMKCREKIYEIKANEVQRLTYRLLQQANLICEVKESDTDEASDKFLTIKRKEAAQ